MRGTLERSFGTIETGLISWFSGRTFGAPHKVFNKPEELAHLTTDELAQMLVLWIVDVYHNTPSVALRGETPANAWKRLSRTVGLRPVPDSRTLREVFGIKLERKLSGEGLKALGLHYSSEELGRHFLRRGASKLQIRLNPSDIGSISYKLSDLWLEARCTESGFDGVTLSEWSQTIHDLRQSFAAENKLTAPIVRRAMRTIRTTAETSRVRENIATKEYSAEDLARLEDEVFLGFSMPKSASDQPVCEGDLLDGGFATGGIVLPPLDPPVDDDETPDNTPIDDSDDFSFEG
ncbi:hypothetical protein [Bosea sp. TAF32]|uniref:hypothetical protein n=1 Tax=Bosea sp. TAF32 TaxID=3237482 RepID=UPI003F90F426